MASYRRPIAGQDRRKVKTVSNTDPNLLVTNMAHGLNVDPNVI
jgi:hypothetical protein